MVSPRFDEEAILEDDTFFPVFRTTILTLHFCATLKVLKSIFQDAEEWTTESRVLATQLFYMANHSLQEIQQLIGDCDVPNFQAEVTEFRALWDEFLSISVE